MPVTLGGVPLRSTQFDPLSWKRSSGSVIPLEMWRMGTAAARTPPRHGRGQRRCTHARSRSTRRQFRRGPPMRLLPGQGGI
jgi:hypothetical protein